MEPFDLNFKNNEKVKIGSLLISDPFLDDRYFGRSVILLCGYVKKGAFGFVLNQYLDIDLHKLDTDFPDINARISLGGPVDKEHLFFIHSLGGKIEGSTSLYNGIYYGGDFDQLSMLFETEPETKNKVRFFIGYSGWSEVQLDEEIKESSWLPANNITKEDIMNTSNDKLWEYCLEKQWKRFKVISMFPRNPEDN